MTRRFQVRDLVKTTEEFGERTFILVSFTETGYRACSAKDGKRYNITDSQINCKVGEATVDELANASDEYNPVEGIAHCHHQAREFPNEAAKWNYLATIKPGQTIKLVHRKMIYPAEFVGVNLRKPVFPIRAKIKGLAHDFRLDALLTG